MKILFLNMLSVSFFATVFIGVFCLVCRVVNRRWISALTWTVGIFVGLRLLFFVPVPLPYTVTFPEGMQMELPKTLLEQRREEYLEEKEREKLDAEKGGQRQGESAGAWLTRQVKALTDENRGFSADILSAAAWIWFTVCLFLLVFRFAGYFRLRFLIFREGKPLTEEESWIDLPALRKRDALWNKYPGKTACGNILSVWNRIFFPDDHCAGGPDRCGGAGGCISS